MQTLAEIIGKNIRTRREALGLSQNKLARVACIGNNASVSRWEDGTFCPGAHALMQLSRVFGCTIDELFKGAQLDAQ